MEHKHVRKDYNLSYILYNLWKETPDPVLSRLVQFYAMQEIAISVIVLGWDNNCHHERVIAHGSVSGEKRSTSVAVFPIRPPSHCLYECS